MLMREIFANVFIYLNIVYLYVEVISSIIFFGYPFHIPLICIIPANKFFNKFSVMLSI